MGRGKSGVDAIMQMKMNSDCYDPLVLATLQSVRESKERSVVRQRSVRDLKEGMTLASDIPDARGQLLITKGRELSNFLLERIRSFSRGSRGVREPISVLKPNWMKTRRTRTTRLMKHSHLPIPKGIAACLFGSVVNGQATLAGLIDRAESRQFRTRDCWLWRTIAGESDRKDMPAGQRWRRAS